MLAAKSLKTNPNIIIRRADKSNTFVILDRIEYKTKLDATSKLKKNTRNPINTLKISVNKIISSINKRTGEKTLQPIIGEYNPGYIYGTIKNLQT